MVFMVVEANSTYNIILRRSAMRAFKAMALTYHQKVKFPVGGRVEEVQGNQATLRKCYVEII